MNIPPKVNWYDGQNVDEEDLDAEQNYNNVVHSNNVLNFHGSGVYNSSFVPKTLFDSNLMPLEYNTFIEFNSFDGRALPKESGGKTNIGQPTDSAQGNQIEVVVSDSNLYGANKLVLILFGKTFDKDFDFELLEFNQNGSLITQKFFLSVEAIMFSGFLGNANGSKNNGGHVVIREADNLLVSEHALSAGQTLSPNVDLLNIPLFDNLFTLNEVIDFGISELFSSEDLSIELTGKATRTLSPTDVANKSIGQKFTANSNNVQKITVLLSVVDDGVTGLDWSGSISLTIRQLQTETNCPTDQIPINAINFDPSPNIIAQIIVSKDDLECRGIVLTETPQKVDFVFTSSIISNPNISPSIEVGKLYSIDVSRCGDNSVGTITVEEGSKNLGPTEGVMTTFNGTTWLDVTGSDMWFEVWSDALKISSGSAYEGGVEVEVAKTVVNALGIQTSLVDGNKDFVEVVRGTNNFVELDNSEVLTDSEPHPRTGNLVNSRIDVVPNIFVESEASLVAKKTGGDVPLLLAKAVDDNPRDNRQTLAGATEFPGLALGNKFVIVNPSIDFSSANLIGSVLFPDSSNSNNKYKIIKAEFFNDAYGDVNGDGIINTADIVLAETYATSFFGSDGYTLTYPDAYYAQTLDLIFDGYLDALSIMRANVASPLDFNIGNVDASRITEFISQQTPFDSGQNFTHLTLTLENLTDPSLAVSIESDNSKFVKNDPFEAVNFKIKYVPTWDKQGILVTDLRRFITSALTSVSSADSCDPGENNLLFPNNVLVTERLFDGVNKEYHPDLEHRNISIRLPGKEVLEEPVDGYLVNILDTFVIHQTGGLTSAGFSAMKWADGSLVETGKEQLIAGNHVKVTAALQGYNPTLLLAQGEVQSATANTLTDLTGFAEFTSNTQLEGQIVRIISRDDGSEIGLGQPRIITEHDADTLTVLHDFNVIPDPTLHGGVIFDYEVSRIASDSQITLDYDPSSGVLSVVQKELAGLSVPDTLDARIIISIQISKSGFLNQDLELNADEFRGIVLNP